MADSEFIREGEQSRKMECQPPIYHFGQFPPKLYGNEEKTWPRSGDAFLVPTRVNRCPWMPVIGLEDASLLLQTKESQSTI